MHTCVYRRNYVNIQIPVHISLSHMVENFWDFSFGVWLMIINMTVWSSNNFSTNVNFTCLFSFKKLGWLCYFDVMQSEESILIKICWGMLTFFKIHISGKCVLVLGLIVLILGLSKNFFSYFQRDFVFSQQFMWWAQTSKHS